LSLVVWKIFCYLATAKGSLCFRHCSDLAVLDKACGKIFVNIAKALPKSYSIKIV